MDPKKSLNPEKILIPKKFGSRTNFDPKIFEPKKIIGVKNFWLGSVGSGWQVQGWVRLLGYVGHVGRVGQVGLIWND